MTIMSMTLMLTTEYGFTMAANRKFLLCSSTKFYLFLFVQINRPTFNIINPISLKLLAHVRVNLSHLRSHKFRHNFLDRLNILLL